jgi:predicted GIY-YIG superfamily endonuclease
MSADLYILRCTDRSYYVGSTRDSLDKRFAEHQAATFDGYTALRRPVTLVFHQYFGRIEDAVAAERQVKGWRREKKEALIRGDFEALPSLSRRAAGLPVRPSRRAAAERSSG